MRYINISSVLLIALISFLLSCDGKQEKISVDVEIEKTYSVDDCTILKSDKTIRHEELFYNPGDFDILALVFIPLKKVIYVPFNCMMDRKYINLTGKEEFSLEECLNIVRETKE